MQNYFCIFARKQAATWREYAVKATHIMLAVLLFGAFFPGICSFPAPPDRYSHIMSIVSITNVAPDPNNDPTGNGGGH